MDFKVTNRRAGAKDPPLLSCLLFPQAALRSQIIHGRREILPRVKVWSRRNPLWISRRQTAEPGQKIRRSGNKLPTKRRPIKRERGECSIHPAVAPVSLCERVSVFITHGGSSGGQNLAALRAAAGQDLTAVGSRHSLTEPMNLGTMTTAGLVGTLHTWIHLLSKINMLDSQKAAATLRK